MDVAQLLQQITIYALPVILAITLHEAAHAFAAKYFGDSTAYMLGRMTLNPIKHIDPIWTIVVPLLTLMFTPIVFGAAKPVPVNFNALRRPKLDMVWVAAAGPAANLLMMIAWAAASKLLIAMPLSGPVEYLRYVAEAGMYVNALFMVFNLFPLLPLDGGRMVAGLLPNQLSYAYSRLEPYGMIILIALMWTPVLGLFVRPLVGFSMRVVTGAFGLS